MISSLFTTHLRWLARPIIHPTVHKRNTHRYTIRCLPTHNVGSKLSLSRPPALNTPDPVPIDYTTPPRHSLRLWARHIAFANAGKACARCLIHPTCAVWLPWSSGFPPWLASLGQPLLLTAASPSPSTSFRVRACRPSNTPPPGSGSAYPQRAMTATGGPRPPCSSIV